MTRLTLSIIFVLFYNVKESNAQDFSKERCSIRLLSDWTESKVKRYLDYHYKLISLRLRIDKSFRRDSVYIKWADSNPEYKDKLNYLTEQIIDSIVISLDNGLSWNLKDGPPEKPPRFIFKILLKKEINEPAVINYFRYLEFCSQMDNSNKNPCKIIDEYSAYTTIKINDKYTFKAEYDVDVYNELSMKAICRQVALIMK